MTYDPDEQDALIAEAEELGGRAFVEMVQEGAALEVAERVLWDGTGPEPPEYREAWLQVVRSMVDARWALINDGSRTTSPRWLSRPPAGRPAAHP